MADKCFLKRQALYIIILLFLMAAFLINGRNVQASSASVTVTTDNSNITEGDTVYVIITITSKDEIGGFKGYFSYDNSVLKYVTGGSVTSGNDDEFLVTDTDRESGTNRLKYAVKFTARAGGNTTIMLKRPYAVYSSGDDKKEMSVSYSPLNIVVNPGKKNPKATKKPSGTKKPKATKKPAASKPEKTAVPPLYPAGSSRLKSLYVKNIVLSPRFSPDIYKYSSTVYTESTSFDIAYETEDTNADVIIKGNGGLAEGKNTIKIIVRNISEAKSVYKLIVKIKRKETMLGNGNIKTFLRNGEVVLKASDEYTVVKLPDKSLIPEGFGITEIKLGESVIKACSPENDTEHKFVLIYCKKGNNNPEFYLYDKEGFTLMPYAKVQSWYRGTNGNTVVAQEPGASAKIQELRYMLAIAVIICLLLVIIIISVYMHFKGMDKDDLSEILNK